MRLDHLLSKEQHCLGPKRMFSECQACSYVEHWLLGTSVPLDLGAPASHSSDLVRGNDRAVADSTEILMDRVFTALF